jgi:hypothetical protein
MTRTATAIFVVLATASLVSAQEKKPAPAPAAKPAAAPPPATAGAPPAAAAPVGPPQPSKELEAFMKPFEGSWKCETKFAANAMGPGSPETTAKSTVKFKRDLDGFFYRGDYEIKKQKGVNMPLKGVFYIGWDPGQKQVVVTGMDNMGGAGFATGKIEGDSAVYSGETYMMGMKVKTRETMTKKGDKEGYHKLEMDMGKGLMMFGEDTCKK